MADFFELQADLQKTTPQRSGRYYGFVIGNVTNVNDDQGLVRVKARIGAQGDTEESDWLIPAFPGSIECKPSKGDPCIVGFIDGDPNRGFWLYHPESTTKGRPSEFMALGTTLAGMINQLRADLQTLVTAFDTHKHAGVTTGAGSSAVSDTLVFMTNVPPGSINAGSVKASDGSAVAPKSGDAVALSGLCKVK